ncbi:MAG: helix-hairpin-helix domain-containing protein [Clostridiales bacterium]|nr:helix-hairpin-helix domain-containing protein [Clostridiales bacterium]
MPRRDDVKLLIALTALIAVALCARIASAPAPSADRVAPIRAPVGAPVRVWDGAVQIDINRADQTLLADLPGIGPTLAGRIVEYRGQHGPFASVDDLKKVRGIGEKVLARIRSQVYAAPNSN